MSRCCDDQLNPPCGPWSEWMTAPGGSLRLVTAMASAELTMAAVGRRSMDQPTTLQDHAWRVMRLFSWGIRHLPTAVGRLRAELSESKSRHI